MPVAAHDDVGVKGSGRLENSVVSRIGPDDLDRLARLDHRGDPGHLGDGRLNLSGDPAELLAEDTAELGEQPVDLALRLREHLLALLDDPARLLDLLGDGRAHLVELLRVLGAQHVELDWHGHNDRGLGVTNNIIANNVAALAGGGEGVVAAGADGDERLIDRPTGAQRIDGRVDATVSEEESR